MEYNAELWAIKRAKDSYGIVNTEYVSDAKEYVKKHLMENLLFSDLLLQDVKPYVLNWLQETPTSIAQCIAKRIQDGLVKSDFGRLEDSYWLNQT
jgi:hypothetical protein